MPTENKPAEPLPKVKRWQLKGFIPGVEGESEAVFRPVVVLADDFDRITAERDALQLRLNEADCAMDKADDDFALLSLEAGQRMDLLEGLLRECLDCVRNGEDFDLPVTTMARIDAALKPVERERNHQIPGTSGMRLNMLANQGE
jgi:hypothetical protein